MTEENGFTLVEVLFALVAGSLLLVTLGWAIRQLEDQFLRHQAPSGAEKVERIASLLVGEVGRALPPATGAAFSGSAERLVVSVPPPRALGAIGPVQLALDVVTRSHGKALVASVSPALADQHLPAAATQPVTLVDGFRDIRFAYLRRATDLPTALPRLITFQFVDDHGTLLPVGVEPHLTMAASCIFDVIGQTCRH